MQKGFDVFNALDLMENKTFLEKLKFGIGDGNLQYYLYNWKCPSMGAEKVCSQLGPPGSGVVQTGPLLTGVGLLKSLLPPVAKLAGSVFPFQAAGLRVAERMGSRATQKPVGCLQLLFLPGELPQLDGGQAFGISQGRTS